MKYLEIEIDDLTSVNLEQGVKLTDSEGNTVILKAEKEIKVEKEEDKDILLEQDELVGYRKSWEAEPMRFSLEKKRLR